MDRLNQTIKHPFKVICVDDSVKPDNIDDDQWIKEGEEYIVTNKFSNILGDNEAFTLLDKNPEPYRGYGTYRFQIVKGNYVCNAFSVN